MLSSGAVTMPPTIGVAMRVMTSEPVPWPSSKVSRPAMTTTLCRHKPARETANRFPELGISEYAV
jgi:hypothetical protein